MKREVFIESYALKSVNDECDLGFVPPMTRRRFSPLQKVVFMLLHALLPPLCKPKVVFASRDGEVKLTHDIVETFNSDFAVSPWKFSSSVYNAAPGLYSVFSANYSTYTAIAAGDETIENSLIEALIDGDAAWCYAEEEGGGYGAAVKFGNGGAGKKIAVEDGEFSCTPIAFEELKEFLEGRKDFLAGKWISLRWV